MLLTRFAQDYNFDGQFTTAAEAEASGPISGVLLLIIFALVIFMLAALWRVYTKAKQPGWAAIIPIYNSYVLLKIVGRPWWWLLLMFVPFVNFIINIIVLHDLSKSFGKDVAFTVLLFFLPIIGYPILAWSGAEYGGPAAAPAQSPAATPPVPPSSTIV